MKLTKYLLIAFTVFFSLATYAQGTYEVKGTVKSASDGFPIPGVNVTIEGTASGVATDFDGNYKLKVKNGDVLNFSSVGFTSKSVTVTGQKTIDVTLAEDSETLEEVVVVGYGARKKSDLTGSVSSVKTEELNAFPVSDATQALQGRAAGVVVQSNNGGEPGAPINIQVRGTTSLGASSNPLIVVDGFAGATMPQAGDIASLEVLKDASATAIYGSRGSGGVIIVTTKKGKEGRLSVEFNSNTSVNNTSNLYDLLNREEFIEYRNIFDPTTPYVPGDDFSDNDWQDLIYRTGTILNNQLSFSGGTDKLKAYASVNYFDQDGVVVNSGFNKLTFLSNFEAKVTDKLTLGLNLFVGRSNQDGTSSQSSGTNANGGSDDVVSGSIRFSPDIGFYNEDGTATGSSINPELENPYVIATEIVNETEIDEFRGNMFFNYQILESLSLRSSFGLNTINGRIGFFVPNIFNNSTSEGARLTFNRTTDLLTEHFLTYTKRIGKGDLSLLAGYSYQKIQGENFTAYVGDLLDDELQYYELLGGTPNIVDSNFSIPRVLESQFGRLNYDYDDRYLFTATVRRDASSVFAANNKSAIFPSAAIAWKVSNEDFFDSNTISSLKLRASYGVTGNQALNPGQSLSQYNVIAGPSFSLVQNANPDLKWETSYQTNVGFDLGLLTNKISLSFDYFNIDTKDLLYQVPVLPSLGIANVAIYDNVGEINNRGFEVSINTRNISNEKFSWTTDLNFSAIKNEIVSLDKGLDILGDASPPALSSSTGNTFILREGEAIGSFYGYDYQGIYDGTNIPEGTAVFDDVEGQALYADVDGDDVPDEVIIGDPNPDFTVGLTNTFKYNNFDLNIFFQGVFGGDILNLNEYLFSSSTSNISQEFFEDLKAGNLPTLQDDRRISSRFVEDGTYVRLKNIALGYSLPSDFLDNMGIDNVRVSISAQNLLTFTNYTGPDPEVSYSGNNTTYSSSVIKGHDFGNYPTIKSLTFGVNVKF